ncbi:polysaccharide deacetylase family protein [Pedobacter sp. SD-b]|uniref:Polysaccharide deacetylase family protein n=1 Tax=Pedobacter segetis TaxID=2793069 RepID=A0ABS1BHN4_9SPHI|nr:polysaccharide deacetylase family protein [Pedobacter segetis]MBK0382396.1 polysaccharide deacetylase family protein [Pedobacter segetis]
MYLVKTPFLLKKIYPKSLIWNKSRVNKTIFLTFDDGPIPIVTPWVLKTLKNFNAKATFFCIGDNITKHPEIFELLKADEHAVGNHTFNHLKGWNTNDEVYLENFKKCQELTQTNLFRPPYGRIKFSQIRKIRCEILDKRYENNLKNQDDLQSSQYSILNNQYSIIMWDVLSGDFDIHLSPEKCLKNVIKHTENGSIVVFHDSLKAWDRLEYVLPKALEIWQKEGYKFECL